MCDHRSPPGETECRVMIWSGGMACCRCTRDDCYRQGWTRNMVLLDNAGRVKRKLQEMER